MTSSSAQAGMLFAEIQPQQSALAIPILAPAPMPDSCQSPAFSNLPGNCRLLPVGHGLFTLVDADIFGWLSQYRWSLRGIAAGKSDKRYARRWETVHRVQRDVYLHREVLQAGPGEVVDHINGDALDNRRANLRKCTGWQNAQNKRSSVGVSGYKGVTSLGRTRTHSSKGRPYKLWNAEICVNGHTHYLGNFHLAEDAARAYDAAAIKHHGEFAATNVMLGLLPPPLDVAP